MAASHPIWPYESPDLGLHPDVRQWLYRRGHSLRPFQARALPLIRRLEPDVLISAPTASGKTEAAILPIVSHILQHPAKGFRAMVVSPMKALIDDLDRRLATVEKELGIPIHRLHGDVDPTSKKLALRQPNGILLITPESLESLLLRRLQKCRFLFGRLDFVVIDELHAFLGTDRGMQVRTLLDRLEHQLQRRITRVGLSATLPDLMSAATFLRDGTAATVREDGANPIEIRLHCYASRSKMAEDILAKHAQETHLVFATAKVEAELLCDELFRLQPELPILPHHASLAPEYRKDAERQLATQDRAICVCTSTLEMGVDLPQVNSVTQLGSAPSVISLRQRAGRSGRRGTPKRMVGRFCGPRPQPGVEQLDLDLLRTVAMFELLQEGWLEPTGPQIWHLSTLVQQLLSHLHGVGLAGIEDAFTLLGPLFGLGLADFLTLVEGLAAQGYLVVSDQDELALTPRAVAYVNAPSFLAAFDSPPQFNVISPRGLVGRLSTHHELCIGDPLVLAGRRWKVVSVDDPARQLRVEPSDQMGEPRFTTSSPNVHSEVARRIRLLLVSDSLPGFLDAESIERISLARACFRELELSRRSIVADRGSSYVFTWASGRANRTLVRLLSREGLIATGLPCGIWCYQSPGAVMEILRRLPDLPPEEEVAEGAQNLLRGKHDHLIPRSLLVRQAAQNDLDLPAARAVVTRILGEWDS